MRECWRARSGATEQGVTEQGVREQGEGEGEGVTE